MSGAFRLPRLAARLALAMALAATAALPAAAHAQREPRPDAALARLDAATRAAVLALADSARAAGLPVAPLHAKAAEGASKGAPGVRIVAAVRELSAAMRQAREALGGAAPEGELVAGAGALGVGVTPDALRQLRAALGEQPATQSLVVLADLVRRGVARPDAVQAVVRLARAGAGDAALGQLRADVARDLEAGVTPRAALETRVRQYDGSRAPPPDPMPAGAPGVPEIPAPWQWMP